MKYNEDILIQIGLEELLPLKIPWKHAQQSRFNKHPA